MRYGIDIFSGAGGLSLGAEMAGIKINYAIEINACAAKTFLRNHKGAKVLQGDIQNLDPKELHSHEKPVFIIMGGPPCQGFSLSNTRTLGNIGESPQERLLSKTNLMDKDYEQFVVEDWRDFREWSGNHS